MLSVRALARLLYIGRERWWLQRTACVAAVGGLTLVLACADTGRKQRLSVATGSSSGVYYLWGAGLATIINASVPGVQISVEATAGQNDNALLLASKQVDFALVNAHTLYEAWNGLSWTKGVRHRGIRVLAALYPSHLTIQTLAAKQIYSLVDLSGKELGLGPRKGTTDVVGRLLVDALGLTPRQYHTLGWSDSVGAVRDGIIDAFFAVGGQPWPPIQDLESTHDVRFIALTEQQIEYLLSTFPSFMLDTIAADTYRGLTSEYKTLAFWNLLAVRDDLPESQAYEVTSAIYQNLEVIKNIHPSTGRYLEPTNISVSPVPVHAGAARYYREKGVRVPDIR